MDRIAQAKSGLEKLTARVYWEAEEQGEDPEFFLMSRVFDCPLRVAENKPISWLYDLRWAMSDLQPKVIFFLDEGEEWKEPDNPDPEGEIPEFAYAMIMREGEPIRYNAPTAKSVKSEKPSKHPSFSAHRSATGLSVEDLKALPVGTFSAMESVRGLFPFLGKGWSTIYSRLPELE